MKKRMRRLVTVVLAFILMEGSWSGYLARNAEAAERQTFYEMISGKAAEAAARKAAKETGEDNTREDTEGTRTDAEEEEAKQAPNGSEETIDEASAGAEEAADDTRTDTDEVGKALRKASRLAVQYDYSGAIRLLKNIDGYKDNIRITEAIKSYRKMRKACVEYPLEEITHVFFHTLIYDTSKAFDGDYDSAGYNQVMTTVREFKKILKRLYQKGYVLVSPHDMATVNADGTMSRGKILVPEGKIPFVLSQDDVSYYHYMDGDGFASRLVLDESGAVKCEYIEDDGSVSVGDYDLVPILDEFVEKHPDFSYHGRKGILAMTGYNGVLGYRTDAAYRTGEELEEIQIAFLQDHPEFDYNEEVRRATEVAEAMKKNGWEFASHTWGHKNAKESTADELREDNERWIASVEPVLGKTDMIIFAFGADIGNWEEYSFDNPKFAYYKSVGYNYYCNVDSSRYWVQITRDFFRQGRRNLDGYRMYYNPDMLSDLFDVSKIWDSSRPTPVAPMG